MLEGDELIISKKSRRTTKSVNSENSQLNRKPIRVGTNENKRVSMNPPVMSMF